MSITNSFCPNLLPHCDHTTRIDSAPWLHLQAAFLPAREVGGDFYRCRILPDSSQWILLGDVSGKGTNTQSAGQIAAAKNFGQEDDITVLTLQSRLPACRISMVVPQSSLRDKSRNRSSTAN